ncbi:RraA family protein [Methylobacterium marchantiae]|uniref:Putative 4-hydroxy-4-methyl-2-oxoglutarate aldolase n=1 Tax=Methylobacterium marchantiae TaxID=600331 RepID=A0ABW3X415_9HYPH|nr:hypothetical protein AIGOOFII_4039 [Methylobacterium marchantiae]
MAGAAFFKLSYCNDCVLVIAGGQEGNSCWGDILANAAKTKGVLWSIIDGLSRDIGGSEGIGYPVYGRGVTMISARNRVIQIGSAEPVEMAGVRVREDNYVIADRCGTVFVPAERIEEVLDLAERIARRQDGIIEAVRGRPPSRRSCTTSSSRRSTSRRRSDHGITNVRNVAISPRQLSAQTRSSRVPFISVPSHAPKGGV